MAIKFGNGIDLQSQRGQNFASPSSGTDAANKNYVDALVAGLAWKEEVRVATTANAALATAYENGDTVDGVSLVTGDRILLKNQTTQTENGIYTVNASGAPTRSTDADVSAELNNATVFVTSGTAGANTAWTQTTANPNIGVSNIVWAQFGAGQTYTADGNGIELSALQFALELDGTSLSKSATGLRIGSAAAANGLIESSGLLSVGAGTGITVNANDVAVDTSVVVRKFAQDIGDGSTTSIVVTHNLGTKDVVWEIREVGGSFNYIFTDIQATTTNTTTFIFAVAPTSAQYRVFGTY